MDQFFFINNSILADSVNGPFDLVFGQTSTSIPYKQKSVVKISDSKDECARAIREHNYILTPQEFRVNLHDLYGTGKIPPEISDGMRENSLSIDYDEDQNLTAGQFEISILEQEISMCLGFFENELFFIYIPIDQILPIYEKVQQLLKSKYGNSQTFGGGGVYVDTWVLEIEKIVIRNVTGIAGHLEYVYAPIKSKQIEYLIDKYWIEFKKQGKDTKF